MNDEPRRIRRDEPVAPGERIEHIDEGAPGEVTRPDRRAADETDDERRRRTMQDGPTGHAPATASTGDPDESDPAAGAEAGAVAGAVSGTMLGGPIGGFIGATLGGVAGAGVEAVDDDSGPPGRVEREPYGHPVRVKSSRETGRDARGATPEEGRPADDDEAPPLT